MRSPKSRLTETLAVLVVAAVILAGFTAARADHGKNGNSTGVGSGSGGNGGGGGDQGGSGGKGGGGGNGGGDGSLASLKTLPIPATDFSAYLNPGTDARDAAIALGKALFWDTQTGGDGEQACASCHVNAGADSRTKGQLNPGAAGAWQEVGGGAGANYVPSASDYPFHKLADMSNRNSQVISDSTYITGSQGLHHTKFVDVFPGSAVDVGTVITQAAAPDVYGVPDANNSSVKVNTRRTTGKNAPSVINAVYNYRNFWDGRAQNVFNGANPSGANDATAFVLASDAASGRILVSGDQPAHQIVRIANAALASQAVGPPNNATEMSYDGRDFKKLGKKMLSLPPLANQLVANDDSVLGPYSNQSLAPGVPGINISYQALIQQAFQAQWWNGNELVDAHGNFVRDADGNIKFGPPTNTSEFTLAEFNFSLFWGIAIQMYESTLVSNDSRFDRYMDGDRTALTPLEQQGMNIFTGKGHCADCHMGATFTDASVSNQSIARVGGAGNPFPGFHMIGVRPATEDKIIAGGAAKTPSLRNVELTPPYFHNGGQLTLEQVVMFYSRGGDFGTRGADMDEELQPRGFSIGDMQALVAFLKSLTDQRVATQRAPFDHPSIDIPNGAMGNSFAVAQDGTGNAADDPDSMIRIPAVGMNGGDPLPTFTAGLQGTPIGFGSTFGNGGGSGGSGGGGNGGGNSGGGDSGGSGGGDSGGSHGGGSGVPSTPTTPTSGGVTTPPVSTTPPIVAFPTGGISTPPAFVPPVSSSPVASSPGFDPTGGGILPLAPSTVPNTPLAANLTAGGNGNVPPPPAPNTPSASSNASTISTVLAVPVSTTADASTDTAPPADSVQAPPDTTASAVDTQTVDGTQTDAGAQNPDPNAAKAANDNTGTPSQAQHPAGTTARQSATASASLAGADATIPARAAALKNAVSAGSPIAAAASSK